MSLIQKLFKGFMSDYVSNYVQKIMKRDLLPDMFNNYTALGVHHRRFILGDEERVVTTVLSHPKITAKNGIEIPL